MNSRQLQYVIVLSEVLNVTAAAEKLNITQPALSKQILSLEKEIGVDLFDRSEVPLKLTPAGESFVKDAKELLFREKELCRSMEDYKTGKKGKLVIGISPFRATYFLSDVIKQLNEKFPGLKIVLSEKNSAELKKDTADGLLDFSVLNLPVDDTVFDIIPLGGEPVVLAVPNCFAQTLKGNITEGPYPEVSLSQCEKIPFITLSKNQELRVLFDKLCMAENVSLKVNAEVVGVATAYNLACAGIGAALLPLSLVKTIPFFDKITLFSLKNFITVRKPAIVKKKGMHVSKYANEAMEIISKR